MKIYMLDRKDCRKNYNGNFLKMIEAEQYVEFDDERIRRAFNFGHGIEKDMERFMEDNKYDFRFYDAEKLRYIC